VTKTLHLPQVCPFYHHLCSSSQWFVPGICNNPNTDPIHGFTTMCDSAQSSDNGISQDGSVIMVSDVDRSFLAKDDGCHGGLGM